ncbi:hypothetical protein EFA69_05255 [Rufibacter immobilis]|uniref:Viral A-type inclusion protein n=1 Tax=Rufibacter immobilis TaxID=1348778 RepID=A0A3M9N293_9BACT|nr:hypothetical protein [Rufibacter immobilis]RNI31919.1 hypothetical protein EFA69_05255 [Rufibacter immobilis]
MKNLRLALFGFALLGSACSPSPQQKVDTLQQEVLALHDSAMAKMGALYAGRKDLAYLKDSVLVQDTLAQRSLTTGIDHLARADEGMMQWMRAYRNPDDQAPEEALRYLEEEKVKIEKVRQEIAQSLRAADSLKAHYRNTSK